MNPEDKVLLERALKLSEDNNKILRRLDRKAKWAFIWGFIKIAIVVTPLVLGYIFLQPYFGQARENFNILKELINTPR